MRAGMKAALFNQAGSSSGRRRTPSGSLLTLIPRGLRILLFCLTSPRAPVGDNRPCIGQYMYSIPPNRAAVRRQSV